MNDSRRVLITGVTRGLGLAMMSKLVELGHRVVGCGRDRERLALHSSKYGAAVSLSVVDVSDWQAVDGWSKGVLREFGAPDLILNNAAIINENLPLWEVSAGDFSGIVDVNIKGVFHVIRAFAPAMIERGSGVIVNFSSGWGRSASADVASYCATKWAIEGMSQALAQDLPAGVSAMAYNPGIINTEMLQSCFGREAEGFPDPDAWAEAQVPYLLSLGARQNGRPI